MCRVVLDGHIRSVGYAAVFPSPRTERVSPGNLVALADVGGPEVVVWRWYDAVVIEQDDDSVRLWEPAHGAIVARSRLPLLQYVPGSRAYVSADLPGAEWWVEGAAGRTAAEADVDLDDVERFYTANGLWERLT